MKKLYLMLIACVASIAGYAQCGLGGYGGNVAIGSSNYCVNGSYLQVPGLQGATYAATTCGYGGYDTELGIYNPSNGGIAFNDDACGLQSYVQYYASTSGTYKVQLTRYSCNFSSSYGGSTIAVSQVNNLSITSSSTTCSGQTINLTAYPAPVASAPSGTGDPGTFSGTGVTGTTFVAPDVLTPTTYVITYAFGVYSTTQTITVYPALPDITGTASTCASGGTSTLSIASTGGNWSSANSSIASVNSSTGVVTGASAGITTISYVSGGGCIVTKSFTVNPIPGSITGTAVVCEGSSTTLSNSVSGGSWSVSDPTVASVDASGVVSGLAGGIITMSYTLPEGCFSTRSLTVNALPAAITGTTDMCMGNTTTLSSATSGGAWSSASSSIVAVNSSTGVVTSRGTTGITDITYTLPTGCAVSTTVNNMVASISGSAATCAGLSVTLSDATAGGTWSSSDATVAPIDMSGIITAGAGGGSSTISYTMTSGCYRTLDFGVYTTPPSITGDFEICVGETTTLTNAAAGGTWSSPATMVTEGPSADGILTGMVAGTSTVSYSLSPVCRTSVIVTVNAIPQVITGTKRVCPGSTTALATVSTGGAWSSSNSLATVDASGVVTGVTSGTSTISYAFSTTGCARTAVVTVNAAVPAIGGPSAVCVGSTIALTNSAPDGVSWSSSNTSVATVGVANGVVTGVSAGVATITFTTGGGCINTTNITVGSVPAITGASSVCVGSTTALANAMSGGVWSSSNPATATVDAAGVVTGVAAGAVNIIYTAGGCSTTKSFNVNALPSAITGYTTACVGTSTTLTSVGNTGTWSSSATSVATVGSASGVVAGVSAGAATMTFTATTGCIRTANVTVVTALGSITGTAVACAGSTAALSNTTTGGTWTSGNTSIATVDASTGVVTAVAAGTATITYGFGTACKVMASFTTRALPAVIGGSTSVCMPVVTTLTNTTAGGTWSSSNTSVATVGSAVSVGNGVVNGLSTGTTDITYTITSTGCYRTTSVAVAAGLNPGTISPSGTPRLRVVSAPHTMTFTTNGVPGGTWSSSNTSVATVDPSTGLVTGVAVGSATISYSITGACTNVALKPMTVAAGRDGDNTVGNITGINLYPNPTTGMFTFETEQAGNLTVFTIDGREVSSYPVEKGATQVFLPSGIAAGIYMCRFTTADGTNTMIRLVYEH